MSLSSVSVRTFLKSVLGLAVALVGGTARAQQNPPRAKLTLSQLIARLRADAALRARFAAGPRLVFGEFGIDPAPYNLPERISEAQMDRLLEDLSRRAGPPTPPNKDAASPPTPVYGPPTAPMAVYGPPAGQLPPQKR
jgi:hypothetical protein